MKVRGALANHRQLQTALGVGLADTTHTASAPSGQLRFRWVTWCMHV